jgi:hypothetical protein
MPVLVPDALGVLHYNGFTFPATTTVSPALTNNVSEDGRSYKSSSYEITATCVLSYEDNYDSITPVGKTSTDDYLTFLRARFSAVRGNFCFANWGYGTIVLNGPVTTPTFIPPNGSAVRAATTYPVTHIPLTVGPKVDIIECRFAGYNKMVVLKIRFTFEIYNSTQASAWDASQRKLTEMALSRSWTTNESGYVARETKGFVRYWRIFDDAPTEIFDEQDYISSIVVPPLPGYQRSQRFDPDMDGRGIRFTITDTPIESPLPFVAPIRHMRMTHSISSGFNPSMNYFNFWMVHFDIDVEVLKNYPKLMAMPILSQMILERMQNVFAAAINNNGQLFVPRLNNKHLLWDMRITDDVTSNRFNWEMTWRCMFNLSNALAISKVLSYPTGDPNNNWASWLVGMFGIQGVSAPNIILETIYRPVSAASGEGIPSVIYDHYNYPPTIPYQPTTFEPPSGGGAPIGPPFDNYHTFSSSHRFESNSQTYSGQQGYGTSGAPYSPRSGTGPSGGVSPPGTGSPTPSNSSYKIGPTSSFYVNHGFAERVGALPAIPTAASYGGYGLTEIGKSATEITQYTIAGGIPVYRIDWYTKYALPVEILPNVNPYTQLSLTLTENQINVPIS